jgi:heme exporter protein D
MPDFQFEGLADFLAMGGDALFVWSSYFVFALFIGWNLIQPRLQRRKIIKLLQARMQREAGLQQPMSGQASRIAG